jgi:hypothetical protein
LVRATGMIWSRSIAPADRMDIDALRRLGLIGSPRASVMLAAALALSVGALAPPARANGPPPATDLWQRNKLTRD